MEKALEKFIKHEKSEMHLKLLDFKVNMIFMENMLTNYHALIQNTLVGTEHLLVITKILFLGTKSLLLRGHL